MEANKKPTYSDPKDKDPMKQLQVIRIPREVRAELRQLRREREATRAEHEIDALAPLVGLSLVAVLYLVGMLIAYTTGYAAAVLASVTPAAAALITTLAIAGSAISVFWLVYAFVRSYSHDEHTDYA